MKTVIIDGTVRHRRFKVRFDGRDYYLSMGSFRLLAVLAISGDWCHKQDLYPNLIDGYLTGHYIYRLKTEIPVEIENDGTGRYRLLNPTKLNLENLRAFPDYEIRKLAGVGPVGPGTR